MIRRRERKAEQKDEKFDKATMDFPTDKIVCGKNSVPERCGSCGGQLTIGGPIWHDKIHNMDFVKQMHEKAKGDIGKQYKTQERIKGVLGGIIDESELGEKPLSFDLSQMCSNLKVINPTAREIVSGFTSLGYKVV